MKERAIEIINESRKIGWVMEPYAKEMFRLYGLQTTNYRWVKTEEECIKAAHTIGYPVVLKIVSPAIIHKTEVDGVVVAIKNDEDLQNSYKRLSKLINFDGVIIEGMEKGVELILGSKYDSQFGTVVMIGIGGTSVEIYKDVVIRLAPVTGESAEKAIASLQGSDLLTGFRGSKPVHMGKLVELMVKFSKMAHELSDHIESIDCNPLFSNEKKSIVADARFILK